MNVQLFFTVFSLIMLTVSVCLAYNKECKKVEKLKLENSFLKIYNNQLQAKYYDLCIKDINRTTTTVISQDMKDAVRLAMKCSHPDNGGNERDFIKYRNLYNQLKER